MSIGIALGLISNPGQGVRLTDPNYQPSSTGSWSDFFGQLLPSDPITPFVETNVLGVLFLAIVVGVATYVVGTPAEPFVDVTRSALAVIQKVLWWIIRLSPIGTAGLIGRAAATYGFDALRPLATFSIMVYVGCATVLFVVYPLLLRFVGGLSPRRFFAGAWPALQLAFVSRSSVGTMPLTIKETAQHRPGGRRPGAGSPPGRWHPRPSRTHRASGARRCAGSPQRPDRAPVP